MSLRRFPTGSTAAICLGAALLAGTLAAAAGCGSGGAESPFGSGGGSHGGAADVEEARRDLNAFFADGMVVGPSGEIPMGAYPMSATRHQVAALERINMHRARVGLPSIGMTASLNTSAQSHCECYTAHASDYSDQDELPNDREKSHWAAPCTGVDVEERLTTAGVESHAGCAEAMGTAPSPELAVDRWMVSLYQRLPIVHPATTDCGYGEVLGSGTYVNTADFAMAARRPDPSQVVLVPEHGAEGVSTLWNGRAQPQPPAPPNGFPSGPVVTATFPAGEVLLIDSELLDDDGQPVEHVALDEAVDDRLVGWSTVALYANRPLSTGTSYLVQLALRVDGVPQDLDWYFRTRGTAG